jgi:hypothetical protein
MSQPVFVSLKRLNFLWIVTGSIPASEAAVGKATVSVSLWGSRVMTLFSGLVACSACSAAPAGSTDLILPSDPRFAVFELSNSAGDGTFASAHGTVLLTFASKDSRYCRAARIPSDYEVVLACREERGWKIEATSKIAPAEASNPTVFGGSPMQEVGAAVEDLRAGVDFLHGQEIIAAAASGWRDPLPVDEQSLNARDILRRTASVYKASKSYLDTGVVKTSYTTQSGKRDAETRFKTAYVAPSRFRFESRMNDFGTVEVGYIVWMDGNDLQTWFSVEPDRGPVVTSIQGALDEAAGISRDASGMIPGLLFSGTKLGGDIVRLTDSERLEDEQVDGFDCFRVRGFRWPNSGEPTTVWIDKESFLIRRVYEEQKFEDFSTRTNWYYKPTLNEPVDAELLRFNRPAPD